MTIFGILAELVRPGSQVTVRELPTLRPPLELFLACKNHSEYAFLFESLEGPKRLAELSLVGFDPAIVVRCGNNNVELVDRREGEVSHLDGEDVFNTLRQLTKTERALVGKIPFRFSGGLVGYVSFEALKYWEAVPTKENTFPDLEFGLYLDGVIYHHRSNKAYYYCIGEKPRLGEVQDLTAADSSGDFYSSSLRSNVSKTRFEETVSNAKEYIAGGDIFQVVLSKRYDFRIDGDLAVFYKALRKLNPSPYMYYLQMAERNVIGSSPEMLVRVDGREVTTYPIAGTRKISRNLRENLRLERELLKDEKELAEHVMLVDLARNDLGKISDFGSVKVPEFMEVGKYSHVQHIVSCVKGTISDNHDCFDALKATFPAGTVSGAPKIRAIEIIDELEPDGRGPYAGAVGYFSLNGNSDFAITIRTLVSHNEHASIQSGAGIVADSVPEREWAETEFKARALLTCLDGDKRR